MPGPHFLIITKGHPFEKGAFFEMLDELNGQYTHVEQPLAASILAPELMRPYDCLVFYDMPGITFEPGGPSYPEPSQAFKTQFLALLNEGKGMVFFASRDRRVAELARISQHYWRPVLVYPTQARCNRGPRQWLPTQGPP